MNKDCQVLGYESFDYQDVTLKHPEATILMHKMEARPESFSLIPNSFNGDRFVLSVCQGDLDNCMKLALNRDGTWNMTAPIILGCKDDEKS